MRKTIPWAAASARPRASAPPSHTGACPPLRAATLAAARRRSATLAPLAALALAAGGCAFETTGLPAEEFLSDDTAADFATGTATELVIADSGFLTPTAHITGAAIARGASTALFSSVASNDTWNAVASATPVGTAYAAPMGAFGARAPAGVGITGGDNFTVWLDGEIWLEAGTHQFGLYADDLGFVEIAPPGQAFMRVVSASWPNKSAGSFIAPADGWYGFRAAYAETVGDAAFQLDHQPPGATAAAPFDPERLRTAAGDARGLITDAFDDYLFLRPVGRGLLDADALALEFGNAVPPDSGITAAGSWSLHWAGQVRIDRPGDYAFTLDTDDGQRLRLDGELLTDRTENIAVTTTTEPRTLGLGWHDLVIEATQDAASAHARLRVASGPDLTGGPLPREHLRPVAPRADRVRGVSDDTDLYFQKGGSVTYTFTPVLPAGATVVGVDVGYTINHPHLRDVEVALRAPDGTPAIIRPQGDVDRGGTTIERRATHGLDGKLAAGAWQLVVRDAANKDGGNTRDGAITIHYRGGHPPITPAATYESTVRDLLVPSVVTAVEVDAATPAGASVAVRLRSCDLPDACAAAPWSDPVTAGARPLLSPGRYVQYRLELTSDGDAAPAVDKVVIRYLDAP